jgi:beta-lactam-binding protein with PASTA domain
MKSRVLVLVLALPLALTACVSQVAVTTPLRVRVPYLVGSNVQEAINDLQRLGLEIGFEYEESDEAAGTVLSQIPSTNTSVEKGALVNVTVSKAPPTTVEVPSVLFMKGREAKSALQGEHLRMRVQYQRVSLFPTPGTVLDQFPTAGTTVERGTIVTVTVARDTEPDCTPGYDPCLPPASDYDCAGGGGNGPAYAPGTYRITGTDPYGLDGDGDGYGCD